jgi:hypothetical protein
MSRTRRWTCDRWRGATIAAAVLLVAACGSPSQATPVLSSAAVTSDSPSAIASSSASDFALPSESATSSLPGESPGPSASATASAPPNRPSPSPSASADDWLSYKSKIGPLTYKYPASPGWNLIKGTSAGGLDWLLGPAGFSLQVVRYAARGVTLDGRVQQIRTNKYNDRGFHLDAVKTVTMGDLSGRQVLMHATFAQELQIDTPAYRARKRYWIFTFILKGGNLYEVEQFADKGHEADDLAFANRFVASVVLN